MLKLALRPFGEMSWQWYFFNGLQSLIWRETWWDAVSLQATIYFYFIFTIRGSNVLKNDHLIKERFLEKCCGFVNCSFIFIFSMGGIIMKSSFLKNQGSYVWYLLKLVCQNCQSCQQFIKNHIFLGLLRPQKIFKWSWYFSMFCFLLRLTFVSFFS